jgi:dATP pyrophosphohydrolase
MKQPKQPVSVLVVIYTSALDVLLLERAAHPGFWQSVTGSKEGQETLSATAAREVAEETGLDVSSFVLSDWQQTNRYEIFAEWRHRYAPGVTENTEHVFGLLLPERQAITIAPGEHSGLFLCTIRGIPLGARHESRKPHPRHQGRRSG